MASRLKLLNLENFKNLHPRRVDSVRRGIDSKPLYTFLTELKLQVESIQENREPRSRGACGANDSAYGDSGPLGVVDIRVKRRALVPYWEPHEFVVLTPLLLKYFRCRWRLAVRFVGARALEDVVLVLLRIKCVNTLSSTGSDLSWVVEAWGVTFLDPDGSSRAR
ncbi:hypothetical protein PIB30_033420 [Stylosanthes scabra]|uniref:Uncharacterized protein n=1 Tax=Stylosanthes scabra TaxID=79078 RepID=A0ABU6SCB5_9FABA|nr:hypothetical protein [Stylosanthes scabra]